MSNSVWPHRWQPPGSPVPEILQARTLEWVAISFSNAWKWKVKAKSLSGVQFLATPWTAACQDPPSMGFSRQKYWSGVPLPSPGRKWRGTKKLLDEGERGEWKSWLKAQHSENEDYGIWSHHFMANKWGNSVNSGRLYFWGLQNHCRWWLQPWN